ncbi:MAG: YpmS family protein [Alicyclobacillus shizuokensis]|nr:YpmS family protein [Alicyclobacillus shizuokensis]
MRGFWKRAFIVLLALDLLVVVAVTVWWGTLPKAASTPSPVTSGRQAGKPATIQLSIGQDAVNAYLDYALSEQPDLKNTLSYARVRFGETTWKVQLGAKLADRVVPFNVVFTPAIHNGNLELRIDSADLGQVFLPPSALIVILRHLPWPAWISVNGEERALNLNFSQRPQQPYGLRVLRYAPKTRLLTLKVTIVPKTLLAGKS